jgi:hypothetical protein
MKAFKQIFPFVLFASGITFATVLPNPQPPNFISKKTVKVIKAKAQMEKVEKRAEYDITRMDGYKMDGDLRYGETIHLREYLYTEPIKILSLSYSEFKSSCNTLWDYCRVGFQKVYYSFVKYNSSTRNYDVYIQYYYTSNGDWEKVRPTWWSNGLLPYVDNYSSYSYIYSHPNSQVFLYSTPETLKAQKKCYYIRNPQTGEETLVGCKLEFKN